MKRVFVAKSCWPSSREMQIDFGVCAESFVIEVESSVGKSFPFRIGRILAVERNDFRYGLLLSIGRILALKRNCCCCWVKLRSLDTFILIRLFILGYVYLKTTAFRRIAVREAGVPRHHGDKFWAPLIHWHDYFPLNNKKCIINKTDSHSPAPMCLKRSRLFRLRFLFDYA